MEREQKYIDIQLADLQREREEWEVNECLYNEQQKNDISKGFFWIEGDKIIVEEKLIQNSFSIILPKEFDEMKEKYISMKYPFLSSQDTYLILTNQETNINIAFNFSDMKLKPEESSSARNLILDFFKKRNPNIIIQEIGELEENSKIAYFTHIMPGYDQELYNFSFFFSIREKLVKGSWSCGKYVQDRWEDVIKQMTSTIKEWDREE